MQRGITVVHRNDPRLTGVIIGKEKGIPIVVCATSGAAIPFDSNTMRITSDLGGIDALDSEINSRDKAEIETGVKLLEANIRLIQKDLATSKNIESQALQVVQSLAQQLGVERTIKQKLLKIIDDNRDELNKARQDAFIANNPKTTFRVSIGTKVNTSVIDKMAVKEDEAIQTAIAMSKAVRRNVILEEIDNGEVINATIFRNGKQASIS